jgi:hypothetical protein
MASPTLSAPQGFWAQIDHQLARIAAEKPETFDAVRAILTDPTYDSITAETNRNGERQFTNDTAFFAGSGGDKTLYGALDKANWYIRFYEASYHYVVFNRNTGETFTYTEGDVHRGDALSGL